MVSPVNLERNSKLAKRRAKRLGLRGRRTSLHGHWLAMRREVQRVLGNPEAGA